MLKKANGYSLIIVAIVALVAIIALWMMSSSSSSSVSTKEITGNVGLEESSFALKCGVESCTGDMSCNTKTNKCEKAPEKIKCSKAADCVYAGYYCAKQLDPTAKAGGNLYVNYCSKGCDTDNDCTKGKQCNTKTNQCVEQCVDSDGEDVTVKSKTTGLHPQTKKSYEGWTDKCIDDKKINEGICKLIDGLKVVGWKEIACPTGTTCTDGVCVEGCTDTDNGKDYFKASTAKVGKNDAGISDSCNDDGTLSESFCEKNKVQVEGYKCPAGCKNNACVAVKCQDSDKGKDYDNLGTVSLNKANSPMQSDYCYDKDHRVKSSVGKKLREYYCQGEKQLFEDKDCSCAKGRCLKKGEVFVSNVCKDSDNGKKTQAKGVLQLAKSDVRKTDYCVASKTSKTPAAANTLTDFVYEYSCYGDETKEEAIQCPDGTKCKDGFCQDPKKLCSDSDDGAFDFAKKGTVTQFDGKKFEDKCEASTTAVDYYCNTQGQAVPAKSHCSFGCNDGACYAVPTCTQIGSSTEYTIKGSAKGLLSTTNAFNTYTDKCSNANTMIKYVCNERGFVEELQVTCDCKGDKCTKAPTCTDPDGGKDLQQKSSGTNELGVPFAESCVDSTTVTEYSCTNNKLSSENIKCAAGSVCKEGACVTCKDTDGENYETKGFVTTVDGKIVEDQCYIFPDGKIALIEAKCTIDVTSYLIETKMAYEYSNEKGKQYVCNDGKLEVAVCSEKGDKGFEISKPGAVTDNFGSYSDSCTGTMLTEYACKDNKLDVKIIPNCKTCKDGVCTQ